MATEEKSGKNKRKIAGNVVFYGLLLLLVFSTDARAWLLQQVVRTGLFNADIKKEAPATVAPAAFSFYTAGGKVMSTSDLKGKVVFINFWATWCPPCRAEMPSLQALYNDFENDDRFVFLFINEDEDEAKAMAYLQKEKHTFPLVTRAGAVPEAVYSGTLPTTVVLDKEGRMAYKKDGIANYNTENFKKQLKSLL